ncbi:MAG: hypothetical protein GVY18_16540 [Bacteroidetes bacterium]|jgi:copper chaperone NosL|nr:hypothetical protein [Bacteroidota bacterium]
MLRVLTITLMLGLLLLAGCTPEPEPIRYGQDECAYCRMAITDPRYGSELVTSTGKTYMFDSIECLAAHVQTTAQESPEIEVHSLWVTDYTRPEHLIRVDAAAFLHSDSLRSPMALNVAAFGDRARRDAAHDSLGGTPMGWAEVKHLVQEQWLEDPSERPASMSSHVH